LTPDTTWTIPLAIGSQSDTRLIATGATPLALQGASLRLGTLSADFDAIAPIRDDPVFEPPDSQRATTHLRNLYDPDEPYARPKDFAFFVNTVYVPPPGVGWERVEHVYAIRHSNTIANADDNEKSLVHAWWREDGVCRAWKCDTLAFRCGGAPWDGLH